MMVYARRAGEGFIIIAGLVMTMFAAATAEEGEAPEEPRVVVSQEDEGDYSGNNHQPIQQALDQLEEAGGGVLLIGPGRYELRRPLHVPTDVTIRGEENVVLALPSPTRVRGDHPAGAETVTVESTSAFRDDASLELLPPDDEQAFARDEKDDEISRLEVTAPTIDVENSQLRLAEPLPYAVPDGARLSYAHHAFVVRSDNVTIEHLMIDGGLVEAIPMPGHARRCGVWSVARYTYEDGPLEPPVENLTIRHVTFRDCYGRAVAMYNVVDSAVVGCRISRIRDEAINVDHFTRRIRVAGNAITDARRGIELNDANECIVEHNRISGTNIGIHMWWWRHVGDYPGVNENNIVRHNVVENSGHLAIRLSEKVTDNTIEYNFIDEPVRVAEPDRNRVRFNTLTE